ncbi:hypothetical protein EVG20_g4746 [Dentipellis fragilis]|uniref:F-box domain-containing protein n=1 Tax=Dentipellis fragilis TaxID=205917 RepID=A0A4Y9YVL4_9AGAM|nr:hypothetical protein EVG20_g4746 [Dentipellis fragilis]
MSILVPLIRGLTSTPMLASWQSVPPIHLLSQDLMQYIWEMGTWESDDDRDNILFPVQVSQVCRSWRALAIDSPTLWKVISLQGELRDSDYFQQQQFLVRSMNCSLTVFINLCDMRREEDESGRPTYDALDSSFPSLARIARLLEPHVRRIETFTVLADDYSVTWCFLRRFGRPDMPKLKCLDVMVGTSNGYDGLRARQIQNPLDLLPQQSAPALKSVSLSGVHPFWPSTLYTGLTSLTICHVDMGDQPSVNELGELLSSTAQSLEYLEVQDAAPGYWHQPATIREEDRIALPNVRELVLGYGCPHGAALMLKLFRYPKVQKLTIRDVEHTFVNIDAGEMSVYDASCIMRVLITAENSLPTVDTLVLKGVCISSADIASKLLNALPVLKTLEINGCSSGFLEALATAPPVASESSEPGPTSALPALLCPSLRNLTIIDMVYREVMVMLRMRKAAGEKTRAPKFNYLSVLWDMSGFMVDAGFPSRLLAFSSDVYYVVVPLPERFRPWSARWGVAPREALGY